MRPLAILLLCLLALCAGCRSRTAMTPAPPPPAADPRAALQGEFELTSLSMDGKDRPLSGGRRPTVRFEDQNRLSGFAGVNRFSGSFSLEGNRLTVQPNLAMTRMAGPPEAMDLEQDFAKAIAGAHTVTASAGGLILESPTARLQFQRK